MKTKPARRHNYPLSLGVGASLCLAVGCLADSPEPVTDDDDTTDETYIPLADDAKAGAPLVFTGTCEPGVDISIAAVGDVLLHGPLQVQAVGHEARFASLWQPIADLLTIADITYANLEGPTAVGVRATGRNATDPGFVFDNAIYTSYPQFNYHPYLLADLQGSGVDVVSTANNHSLDRRELGVDRTIDALHAVGLPYTGTRKTTDGAWHTVTSAKGINIAWLACTYGTNGIPDRDQKVLHCWDDEAEVLALIGELAADPAIDLVAVTPHWGDEYNANPNTAQKRLAKKFADAGASLIFGSHPHVTQPWAKLIAADGREVFVIYSLGNFVSGQTALARKSTLLAYVGIHKSAMGTVVTGVKYVPLYMNKKEGVRALEAIDRGNSSPDSRTLTTSMYGLANLLDPEDAALGALGLQTPCPAP